MVPIESFTKKLLEVAQSSLINQQGQYRQVVNSIVEENQKKVEPKPNGLKQGGLLARC